MLTISEISTKLTSSFPLDYVDSWDNTGLVISCPSNQTALISKILLTNDVTNAVIKEASKKNISLIISYHPLCIKPERTFTANAYPSNMIFNLIQNNISLFTLHTTLDISPDSMTESLLSFLNDNIKSVNLLTTHKSNTNLAEQQIQRRRLSAPRDESKS